MSSDTDDEYPRAPAQKARDENILGVFEETADPVLTTSEVAEELPIGKRATLNRLEDLVERGEIESKDVGVGRVWWRAEPEPIPESGPALPDTVPEPPSPSDAVPGGTSEDAESAADATERPAELDEDPRWAFLGSLGKHSIFAGIFLIGLLLTESVTTQTLLPVSVTRLFLTAFVFFLIGFPVTAAYRANRYLESTDLSLSQFFGGDSTPEDG